MGDVADAMLDGSLCQGCGECLGEGDGFPTCCNSCESDDDLGEMFKALRADKKEKRALNTERSTQILVDHGIKFESKNNGAHLIVTGLNGLIDFWPSTGKYIVRKGGDGRGVFNLLKLCK